MILQYVQLDSSCSEYNYTLKALKFVIIPNTIQMYGSESPKLLFFIANFREKKSWREMQTFLMTYHLRNQEKLSENEVETIVVFNLLFDRNWWEKDQIVETCGMEFFERKELKIDKIIVISVSVGVNDAYKIKY